MGFLTDEEIEERIKSPENLANKIIIHKLERGRPVGSEETPKEIKKLVAALTAEGESQVSIREAFDLDKSVVSNIAHGRTSNGNVSPDLQGVQDKVKTKIKERKDFAVANAIDTLLSSIAHLDSKLPSVKKAVELSSIARNMSGIVSSLTEKEKNKDSEDKAAQVHLHIYAPKQKEVEEYEIIDV